MEEKQKLPGFLPWLFSRVPPNFSGFSERAFLFQALKTCFSGVPQRPGAGFLLPQFCSEGARQGHCVFKGCHWRTLTDKFSRAGEIVEIMRGTLLPPLHISTRRTGSPNLQSTWNFSTVGLIRATHEQTPHGHGHAETSGCLSLLVDAIGLPSFLDVRVFLFCLSCINMENIHGRGLVSCHLIRHGR